jgi:hypothetical protein
VRHPHLVEPALLGVNGEFDNVRGRAKVLDQADADAHWARRYSTSNPFRFTQGSG